MDLVIDHTWQQVQAVRVDNDVGPGVLGRIHGGDLVVLEQDMSANRFARKNDGRVANERAHGCTLPDGSAAFNGGRRAYATPAQQFGFGWHDDAEDVLLVLSKKIPRLFRQSQRTSAGISEAGSALRVAPRVRYQSFVRRQLAPTPPPLATI